MKKVAAVFVSIGVILVIVGLIIVGIYGRDQIKDGGIFSFGSHNLASANGGEDKTAAELEGLEKINITVDNYDVYLLASTNDVLSVKYIDPWEEGTDINVDFAQGVLNVTQKGNVSSHYWGFSWFSSRRFIAVYIPQTEQFTQTQIKVTADYSAINVDDIQCALLDIKTSAGSVNIDDVHSHVMSVEAKAGSVDIDEVQCYEFKVSTSAGSVNIDGVQCYDFKVSTNAGSVHVEGVTASFAHITTDAGSTKCEIETDCLTINSGAGSIKFTTNASTIDLSSGAGSISGTVEGNKSEYKIDVDRSVGSSNLSSQTVPGATKSLKVKSSAGSIKIHFDND